MKKLLLWLIPCYMMAQNTAIYPNRAITINDLTIAVNNFKTQLTSNIDAAVTTLPVQNATAAVVPITLMIGGVEAVLCTGKTQTSFTGCTRGFDNTVAVPHSRRDAVANVYAAFNYNQPAAEMIAIQSDLIGRLEAAVLLGTIRGAISASSPLVYDPGTGEFSCPFCGSGGSGNITVSSTDPVCDTVGKQWIDTVDPNNTAYSICLKFGGNFMWVGYSPAATAYQIPQVNSAGALVIPGGITGGVATACSLLGAAIYPTMTICSDCNPGTTPCTCGGNGAYAFATSGGTWACPF